METSLHRQLKRHYAGETGQVEAVHGPYRIDAVRDGELIEIQHGGLAAIRDKVARLLRHRRVRVVKPIVVRKTIVKLSDRAKQSPPRRLSPKRGGPIDLFHELVHFTRVFPHQRLTLEVPMVEIEEHRRPGHGRRRRWRKSDFVVEDQSLVAIGTVHTFREARDLLHLLPADLASPFDTHDLAQALEVDRWIAQRVAYCLRQTGAVKQHGKRGNSLLYALPDASRPAA